MFPTVPAKPEDSSLWCLVMEAINLTEFILFFFQKRTLQDEFCLMVFSFKHSKLLNITEYIAEFNITECIAEFPMGITLR
jgi:hypothetical protein